MPSRSYALTGQVTRFKSTLRLHMERGQPARPVETNTHVEVTATGGAVTLDFAAPVPQLPIDVDVDDVVAEVYVILHWGDEKIALGPGGIIDQP